MFQLFKEAQGCPSSLGITFTCQISRFWCVKNLRFYEVFYIFGTSEKNGVNEFLQISFFRLTCSRMDVMDSKAKGSILLGGTFEPIFCVFDIDWFLHIKANTQLLHFECLQSNILENFVFIGIGQLSFLVFPPLLSFISLEDFLFSQRLSSQSIVLFY